MAGIPAAVKFVPSVAVTVNVLEISVPALSGLPTTIVGSFALSTVMLSLAAVFVLRSASVNVTVIDSPEFHSSPTDDSSMSMLPPAVETLNETALSL